MEAKETMQYAEAVNQQFRAKSRLPSHKHLTSCGWRQIDGNGLFFRSPANANGYAVDMKIPNNHLTFIHNYHDLEELDSVPGPDLEYLHSKLEDIEIWLAL